MGGLLGQRVRRGVVSCRVGDAELQASLPQGGIVYLGWRADGLHAIGAGFRGRVSPRFGHRAETADIQCAEVGDIHADAAGIHRADVGDGLRAVGTCSRGQTLPHFTHPTSRDPQFAIRRMGEARHAPCKNPAKDRA